MKKLLIYFFSAALFLLTPIHSYGHDLAQPHFLKINTLYLDHYSISSTSLPDFLLPRETLKSMLLVGKPTIFQIEKDATPIKNIPLSDSSFSIDFGDGIKKSGIYFEHTYQEQGSYILTVSIESPFLEKETVINTALIHVGEPNSSLPTIDLFINGIPQKEVDHPVAFSEIVTLEAKAKKGRNIVNYFWDLGDGTSSDKAVVNHVYKNYHTGATVLLRIKDDNGFIFDKSVRLISEEQLPKTAPPKKNSFLFYSAFILGLILILLILLYKRKNSH